MCRKGVLIGRWCALMVCALIVPGVAVAASGRVRVGTIPSLPAHARDAGSLPGGTDMRITVVLEPRNPAALRRYAMAVATPGSGMFRDYLTVSEFARRFGPTPLAVDAVRAELRARGLIPGPISPNDLAIPVSANAAALARALYTSFERLSLADGRIAYRNATAPLLSASTARYVQAIVGLADVALPAPVGLPAGSRRTRGASDGTPSPSALPQPHLATGGPQPCPAASNAAAQNGGATADQLASAYGFSGLYGTGDFGAGVTVALAEYEPNFASDISTFQACYGTQASVSYIEVDGGPKGQEASDDGEETELDAEGVLGLAPKVNLLIYQGNENGNGFYDTMNAIVSQDRAKVMSTSWGTCESEEGLQDAKAENTLFNEAATQGQTVLVAAGDDGAQDCYATSNNKDTALAVDDPGSQPNVTDVGGTTLSALGPPPTQSVWNTGLEGGSGGAAGGGISEFWTMPGYQTDAPASLHVINSGSSGKPCKATSGYCREVPDVSSDANPGIIQYDDGSWYPDGGTSLAAPTFAALIALADASSACHGIPIGFANPALYATAASAYARDFNDITVGDNDFTGTNGGQFAAGPGYDMASGLGTPIATPLAASLCDAGVEITPPGSQHSTVGKAVKLQLTAYGAVSSYSATGLPPGLTIDRSSGLISGKPTASGSYKVTVQAMSSGGTAEQTFTWTVAGPPTISSASLSGFAAGHPQIRLTSIAGPYAPALYGLAIYPPSGVSWAKGKQAQRDGISLRNGSGRSLAFSVSLSQGYLNIVLAHNAVATQLRLVVSSPAVTITSALRRRVKGHRAGRLTFYVSSYDADNRETDFELHLKPS
ncbi:MAG TPA: protease pro-enzyme activation domain-containing protein [Solirubrobacteraceae bacterium]|nr:protease pro-enzyme activation domain-containing protein [Solirubrobacteraceae bacterium]